LIVTALCSGANELTNPASSELTEAEAKLIFQSPIQKPGLSRTHFSAAAADDF
jgi:hypothetical protein